MTFNQITAAVTKLYSENGHRIVLWHDPERKFADFVATLELDGVNPVYLDEQSSLEIKKRIKLDDPSNRYLLYRKKEPHPWSTTGCWTCATTTTTSGQTAPPS
jgi:hypothetical protein